MFTKRSLNEIILIDYKKLNMIFAYNFYIKIIKMYNCIEVTMWLVFGLIWYQGSYFIFKKQPKVTISNDELIKYNNVLNEYYYNEFLYKNKCQNSIVSIDQNYSNYINGCINISYKNDISYEGFWENNVENGFSIISNKEFEIKGYKKNNMYYGLVRINGYSFDDNNFKSLDCVYENGKKNVCYFIDKNNNIKFVVPDNISIPI